MSKANTPRPVPQIHDELTFSRKKKTLINKERFKEPRSPVKSAPPVSRIFRHRKPSTPGALAVSFRQSQVKGEVNIQSPLYKSLDQLYFDQCFTKLGKLGSGSFGDVFKVQSKEDGKLYAIKKSCERFRGNFDRKQRLEEVNKNEKIDRHPNCVSFFKAWEERDYLYIQTELCEMSLKDYAESVQNIEEKEIWNMIVDLCHGLKHLHDSDFAHMDIKPANLFLGRDGFYKIGDFGLVVELTRDLNDAMDGDSKYLAPELMEGHFSKAADIFSLGITLLELACSLELPKGGPLWHQLRENQLPLEFSQGLSDDLIELIKEMMDSNPVERPSVDDILKMSSVTEAKNRRRKVNLFKQAMKYIVYFWLFIYSYITRIFRTGNDTSKKRVFGTPPPLPTFPYDGEFIQQRDDSFLDQSHSSMSSANQLDDSSMSPFIQRSPMFKPISDAKELSHLKPPSPFTGNFSSSSPNCFDCSPPVAPLSEKIIRSRLFTCSSDEEEAFATQKISKNLIKCFNEYNEE